MATFRSVLVMPPTPVEELNDFWVANIRDIRCKSAKTPDVNYPHL